jgi:septal ring factor EnvC (AmiA/AmiB activator)
MATRGRPKGSKNTLKFPLDDKQLKTIYKDKELDRLKNLVARQDDQIIQMCDEINQLKKEVAELGEEIDLFVTRVANYRQIIATLIEVTE